MSSTNEDQRSYEYSYCETLDTIPPTIVDVLERYSGVPQGQQQIDHVLRVRDRAYKARPYPCLGRFRFLALDLSRHPLYNSFVLPALTNTSGKQAGPIFLDMGTCLGQDIRKLIYDGADPSKIYGSDIVPEFIEAGYELFQDKDRFPQDHFLCPGNVFDKSEKDALKVLEGNVDILHATAVFHLFSGEQQARVAERCLSLLRKDPGTRALILGAQLGNVEAREFIRKDGAKRYRHDEKSWKALWEDVCARDEFKSTVKGLEVRASLYERQIDGGQGSEQQKHIGSVEEGFRWMIWQVWVQF